MGRGDDTTAWEGRPTPFGECLTIHVDSRLTIVCQRCPSKWLGILNVIQSESFRVRVRERQHVASKIKANTAYLHRECSSLRCRPFTGPEWRNGRRAGFKIPYPSLGVWVRLPPSVLFSSVIIDSQTCSEPRLFRGFRISGGGCLEALLASDEFAAVVRASLRFSDFLARFGPVDGPEKSSVSVAFIVSRS